MRVGVKGVEWQSVAEEGNSLKKHYVTKECMHGLAMKRPRLWKREKGVLLGQIWRLGTPTEGLFSLSAPIVLYGQL